MVFYYKQLHPVIILKIRNVQLVGSAPKLIWINLLLRMIKLLVKMNFIIKWIFLLKPSILANKQHHKILGKIKFIKSL